MLKMISFRTGFVTIVTIFLLLMVYIIPNENRYSLELLSNQKLEYIDYSNYGETIYLLDNNNYVARTSILLSDKAKTVEAKAGELLNTLIVGNKDENIIPGGFRAVIPVNTKINDISYNNGLIEVDFSKHLLNIKETYEEKMIEAIVYTLISIEGVNRVLISVEGKILDHLPKNNIILLGPLDKNYGINKIYDLNNRKNITKVTIYYLSKNNDYNYYIPVTKYINDSKEKIKIIIDELKGDPIYETNLMSFLNTRAKLLNYEKNDNKIILHFNDYLLDDIKTKKILEEVSYCIALSIFDNYDVKAVVFSVNSEIIKTVTKDVE